VRGGGHSGEAGGTVVRGGAQWDVAGRA
jgi:hypothetical protein